jgi:hypothetical protein
MTKSLKRVLSFLERNELLVVILLLTTVIRLPSLYEPHWYGDEGIYLVLGQALRKGFVWYQDIFDHKPPLLYLIAALSGNVMWFRFLTLIANLTNIWIIWRLAEKLLSSPRKVALVTLLFALVSSLPALEGNIANAEIFMILPASAAMLWLLEAKGARAYLGSGLLFSLAFLLKVPAGADFGAAFIWLIFFGGMSLRPLKKSLLKLGLLVLGFTVPVILSFIYYFAIGAGQAYLATAFFYNIDYISVWQRGALPQTQLGPQSGLMIRFLVLAGAVVVTWLLTRREKPAIRLLPIWLGFTLFAALLSERPYPHYLIQVLPPLVLLVGAWFGHIKQSTRAVFLGTIGLLLLAFSFYSFSFYPVWSYYQNFGHYMTGQISTREYRNYFDSKTDRNYQIADYIRLRTNNDDQIYVWGNAPFIYVLAKRLPVGPYTVAFHVESFGDHSNTIEKLQQYRPPYIVVEDSSPQFPALEELLLGSYVPVETNEGATIFRRLNINE